MLEIRFTDEDNEEQLFFIDSYEDWKYLFLILNQEYLQEPIEDWISRRDLL